MITFNGGHLFLFFQHEQLIDAISGFLGTVGLGRLKKCSARKKLEIVLFAPRIAHTEGR